MAKAPEDIRVATEVVAAGQTVSITGPLDSDVFTVTALGGGLKLAHEKKFPFDEALCNRILGLSEVPGDRNLRDDHVNYLLATMMRGTFRPELVKLITAKCKQDGKEYRCNGQHCCWSRLYMLEKVPGYDPGPVSVMTYDAETLNDVRILYATIDRNAPRTKGNVVNSYLAGTEQFATTPKRVISMVASGLAAWLWESSRDRSMHDGDDIAYKMQTDYAVVVNKVTEYIMSDVKNGCGRHMRRSPVSAALLETFHKAPSKAPEFWTPVRDGLGLTDQNDPRLKLRNYLMESSMATDSQGAGLKLVNAEEMFRCCVHAWNAWRRGDPIKQLRSGPLDTPRPRAK